MRDGTKLNRWGLVQIIAYQQGDIAELRAKLEAAEKPFELEDDGVPDYATPAYKVFNAGISFAVAQLEKVLDVKEWSTSGGGTETLDGDLRSELYDLLEAAGFTSDDKTPAEVAAELTALRTAAAPFDDEAECFYVQNLRAGYVGNSPMFWAKGGNGYTSYIDKAERFTAKDALELLEHDPNKWQVWPAAAVHRRQSHLTNRSTTDGHLRNIRHRQDHN